MNRAPLDLGTIYRVLELGPVPTPPPTLLELQRRAKTQRRRLAAKYHPDVTGDDARMQDVNRVADHVARSELLIDPAPRGGHPSDAR